MTWLISKIKKTVFSNLSDNQILCHTIVSVYIVFKADKIFFNISVEEIHFILMLVGQIKIHQISQI